MAMMKRLERLEEDRQMRMKMKKEAKLAATSSAAGAPAAPSRFGKLTRVPTSMKLGRQNTAAPERMDLASVAILAQLKAKRQVLRWRGKWEYRARLGLSWAANFTICGLAYMYSIALAVKFGNNDTTGMIISWLVAYGWTFAIVEPVQVIILAGTPCLFDEETRCGRCMSRARFIYNELCAP